MVLIKSMNYSGSNKIYFKQNNFLDSLQRGILRYLVLYSILLLRE